MDDCEKFCSKIKEKRSSIPRQRLSSSEKAECLGYVEVGVPVAKLSRLSGLSPATLRSWLERGSARSRVERSSTGFKEVRLTSVESVPKEDHSPLGLEFHFFGKRFFGFDWNFEVFRGGR